MKEVETKYISVYRHLYSNDTTIGKLVLDTIGTFCYTLEDEVRPPGIKIKKETAIPENYLGYKVGIRYSPGFKRDMLILYTEDDKETLKYAGVSFRYVYFHGGNDHTHTAGCILVGENVNEKDMTISNTVENKLKEIVTKWLDEGHTVLVRVINLPYSCED